MKDSSLKEKIKYFYHNTSKDNLSPITDFYAPDIEFIDPVGQLKGRDKIKKYYKDLYSKAESVKFEFQNMFEDQNTVVAVWKMTFIGGGVLGKEPIIVDGNSVITFNEEGKAIYHRDYFDMGEFIYEHVPVMGFMIRQVKERLKKE